MEFLLKMSWEYILRMIIGTQNVRTVALMFIVLMYLLFGAAVFNACKWISTPNYDWSSSPNFLSLVESKEEHNLRENLEARIARILFKNETIRNEVLFTSLTTAIFDSRHFRSGTTKQWTFPGAFYFSTLVVTLIGKVSIDHRFLIVIYRLFRLRSYNTED